ncbi:MAG: hypothetical protein WCO52_02080 [bacterium]
MITSNTAYLFVQRFLEGESSFSLIGRAALLVFEPFGEIKTLTGDDARTIYTSESPWVSVMITSVRPHDGVKPGFLIMEFAQVSYMGCTMSSLWLHRDGTARVLLSQPTYGMQGQILATLELGERR